MLRSGRPERIADVSARLGLQDEQLGVIGAETALLVPLRYRERALGVLCAFDRLDERAGVRRSRRAAAAVVRGERRDRGRDRAGPSRPTGCATACARPSSERSRWARELHDETLQGLAALGVLLAAGLRAGGEALEQAARQATEQLSTEIANLRALITELRPAALDQLGLEAAIDGLARRAREVDGLEVGLDVRVGEDALDPELKTAVYRLVQEALTNVGKHAARRARRRRASSRRRRGARAGQRRRRAASTRPSRPRASAWRACASAPR